MVGDEVNYDYDTRPKKRKFILIVFVLTLLAVPLVIGLISGSKDAQENRQASQSGDEFMTALVQNDAAKSYNAMTKRLQEQVGTLDEWVEVLSGSMGSGGGTFEHVSTEPIENLGNTYNEGNAPQRIEYTVSLKGKSYTMHLVIINDNGVTKVDEYNSVLRS